MRAGDRHAALQSHQLGEHQGARHDRNARLARRYHFRIVVLHRARDDDRVGAGDLLGPVLKMDLDAEAREPAGGGVGGEVGAAHLVAEVGEDFGDARHADAADTDEVQAAHLVFHRALGARGSANSMQRCATTFAASGLPSARAFSAIFSSAGRSSEPISSASRGGVSRVCGTRIAAPRSARKRALALWWSSTACGNGTRMLAMPAAESSAMVTAPARQITTSASA